MADGIDITGGSFESLAVFEEKNVTKVKKQVAVELEKRLLRRSPVDTGQFRANWTFKAGNGDDYDRRFYEGKTSRDRSRSARALKEKQLKTRDVLVSNNVPYADRLNNGWSRQAPMMFVELSIREALNAVF